jgi:hypothetical protein
MCITGVGVPLSVVVASHATGVGAGLGVRWRLSLPFSPICVKTFSSFKSTLMGMGSSEVPRLNSTEVLLGTWSTLMLNE